MRVIALICLLLYSSFGFSQSKLKSAKDSFKSPDLNSYNIINENDRTYSNYSNNDESKSLLEILFWDIGFELTLGLTYYALIESPSEMESPTHTASLQPYPFYGGEKGDYTYENQNFTPYRWKVSDSYFQNSKRLKANDLQVEFQFLDRCAVNGRYLHFWERPINSANERMDIILTTFDYYRIRTPRFTMNWGIGAGYIGNEIQEFGFSLKTGTELYFRPISMAMSYQYTFFRNNDISLFEIGPKYYTNRYFVQLKYQNYHLGWERVSGFSAGLGMYF